MTRHPVLTNELLKLKLRSGRVLKGTAAKSFVTIKDGRLVPTMGSDLKLGDLVPVTINNPHDEVSTVQVREYLSPDKYLYGSHVHRLIHAGALESESVFEALRKEGVTVPMTHDAFVRAKIVRQVVDEYIYPAKCAAVKIHFPEVVQLDFDFGWLCGMYVAEGSFGGRSRVSYIAIASSHTDLHVNIARVAAIWNLKTTTTDKGRNVNVYCTILAELFLQLFGRGSANKRIHPSLFAAPIEWVAGFLSGYIDGDGCIHRNRVICASISEGLLHDIQFLATRYKVTATFGSQPPKETTMKNGSIIRTSTTYRLVWSVKAAAVLRDQLRLVRAHKREALAKIKYTRSRHMLEVGDVVSDPIIAIDAIPWHEKVYDLTVTGFKTFNLLNGIVASDTFHFAGIGNAAVTTGFPRLRALITNNRNAENNVLRLYLRKEYAHDEQMAVRAARHIRNIYLEELIVSREVTDGIHPDDQEWFDLWHLIMQRPLFHDMDQFYNRHVGRLLLHKASTIGLCTTPDVMHHICEQIRTQFDGNVTAVPSPTCLKVPVILLFVVKDVVKENATAHNLTPKAFAHRLIREMPDIIDINGVAGVTDVFVRGGPHAANQDDFMVRQGFAEKDEYFIETNGGDLIECFAAAMDMFDEKRSFPSNPAYAQQQFGVESCRQILINELAKVLAETSYVDHHHVALLVDCMVQSGNLMSVTRQTQQKIKFSGVLDIATFEQGIKVLTGAALRGAKDDLQGTSARVATGRPVKAGTGYFDIKLFAQNMVNGQTQ